MLLMVAKLTLIALSLLAITGVAACSGAQQPAPSGPASSASPSAQPARTGPPGSPITKPSNPATPPAAPKDKPANMVTGNGNLAIATDAKLNFATGGKIEKLNVKKGDIVKKGAVLAKLETASLEVALSQAKVALDQANLARAQAATSLESARYTLDKTKAIADIKDEITEIQWELKIVEMRYQEASKTTSGGMDYSYLREATKSSKDRLAEKNKELTELLAKPEYSDVKASDITGQKYDRLTIEDVRMKQLQVESARLTLEKSQDSIDHAQKNLELVQKQLNDATIIATLDGVVATLDVKEGDIIGAPSQSQKPIIYIIDPTTMELNINVNELDVPKIKAGQKTTIVVDAFPNLKLEGKVSTISPVPSVQGRIVDYEVKIAFAVPATTEIRMGMNATAAIVVD